MTKFTFADLVGQAEKESTALGASAGAKFTDADMNKAVKLGTAHNYVPVAAGDELEAVAVSLEAFTVNAGFSFGSIVRGGYMRATVDSNAVVTQGALVVAGTQAALGTAQARPVIRAGTPTKFLWRVVDLLTGAGAINTEVIIERI